MRGVTKLKMVVVIFNFNFYEMVRRTYVLNAAADMLA